MLYAKIHVIFIISINILVVSYVIESSEAEAYIKQKI